MERVWRARKGRRTVSRHVADVSLGLTPPLPPPPQVLRERERVRVKEECGR